MRFKNKVAFITGGGSGMGEYTAYRLADGGAIVNVTSVYGKKGMEFNLAYSAGKHGGHGMTKVAALEYAEDNIRVNTVLPGVIQTPILGNEPEAVERIRQGIPTKKIGKPEEVANAICFLLSDEASYITGAELAVDGGFLI